MKFELNKIFEIEGEAYDISYAIDEYMNSERYKHGENYGEIEPIANERDAEDWTTIHRDLGENRIFKFEITKEDDKYFVELNHPVATELIQSGNCKFSKRSIIDTSEDEPKFKIITLDIVLNELEITKHIAKASYRLEKIKEGDWFGNKIRMEYYTITDKNVIGYEYISPVDFVILSINGKEVFKGELDTLMYGSIEPSIFRHFIRSLNNKGDNVEISEAKEIIEIHYTKNNRNWYVTSITPYILEYEYNGLETLNDKLKYNDSKVNFAAFSTNTSYPLYIFYYENTGDVIKIFERQQKALEFIIGEFKISLYDFTEIRRRMKDLDLDHKRNIINLFPHFNDIDTLDKKISKLEYLKDRLPDDEPDIIRQSSRGLNTKLRFHFMNKAVNKYRVLGIKDEVLNLVTIGTPDDYIHKIFVSEDMKNIFVEIPKDVLKEDLGINISTQYDKKDFYIVGDDNITPDDYKKIFTVFYYDNEFRGHHICVNVTDNIITNIMSCGIIKYINEKYGEYLPNILDSTKRFLSNIEKNTKLYNMIDKRELGEYFNLYKDGVLSEEDDAVLEELIKIRKNVLEK